MAIFLTHVQKWLSPTGAQAGIVLFRYIDDAHLKNTLCQINPNHRMLMQDSSPLPIDVCVHYQCSSLKLQEGRSPFHWGVSALLTGLSSETLETLECLNPANDAQFWEQEPGKPFADSELVAAARMTVGVLLPEEQTQIFGLIRNLSKTSTDELDALANTFDPTQC